ncbi:hypothetical protein MtrunA17_Chr6g0463381 [Medicago truncatula]|uniref:Transmembrane protein n=1 Tax=Medicago truncatula TaxID=3880 RepID=A0A396HCM6_MEDTR|nr:hypothetical protein MtrunA17_Chr6g0463381 [Medicago truncatula]
MLFFLKLQPAIGGMDTRRYVPAFWLFVNWIAHPYMFLVLFFLGILYCLSYERCYSLCMFCFCSQFIICAPVCV